jgi:hypothetical protein
MKIIYTENIGARKESEKQEHEIEKLMKKVTQLERENIKMRQQIKIQMVQNVAPNPGMIYGMQMNTTPT